MICPNCNKQIPDNSAFCTECGSKLTDAPVTATNVSIPAKQRGLTKKQYLSTEAPEAIRRASTLCLAIFAVLAVFVLISVITLNSMSVFDLPFIKVAVPADERENMKDQSEDAFELFEEAEEEFEDIKDEFTKSDRKKIEKLIKSAKAMAKKESISNMIAFVNSAKSLADMDELEDIGIYDIEDEISDLDEIAMVLGIVRTITYIFGIIVIGLLFLAAFFKRTGVVVLSVILYVPFCMLAISVLWGLLIFAGSVVLAMFTSKVNKAWKQGA